MKFACSPSSFSRSPRLPLLRKLCHPHESGSSGSALRTPLLSKLFNQPNRGKSFDGIKVGDPELPASSDRVFNITDQVRAMGLWLLERVNVVLEESEAGAIVFGDQAVIPIDRPAVYGDFCRKIAIFFRTRVPPVAEADTIETLLFIKLRMKAFDDAKSR